MGHTSSVNKLKTSSLVKIYNGRKVVDNVSIELKAGEVVGLLGPNGAGKTTTFSMILGFILPDKGRIFLNDEDITYLPIYKRARKGIGFLSQEASIFRGISVKNNIKAIMELRGYKKDYIEHKTNELMEKFHINHIKNEKGATLSGGERRRTEIARALSIEPVFLLLDEPFTGIDPKIRGEIQNIIVDLKNEGLGILITDHNVRETLEITDRAYIMYDSEILISGTPKELLNDEKVKKVYLGEKFKI